MAIYDVIGTFEENIFLKPEYPKGLEYSIFQYDTE